MCMEDILAQPWFCEALPEGALKMNDFYLAWSAPLSEVSTIIIATIKSLAVIWDDL